MAEKGIPMPAVAAGQRRHDTRVLDKVEVDLGELFASSERAAGQSNHLAGGSQQSASFAGVVDQAKGLAAHEGFVAAARPQERMGGGVAVPSVGFGFYDGAMTPAARQGLAAPSGPQTMTTMRFTEVAEPSMTFSAPDGAFTPAGHQGKELTIIDVTQKSLDDRVYRKFLQKCAGPDSSAKSVSATEPSHGEVGSVAAIDASGYTVRTGFYFHF